MLKTATEIICSILLTTLYTYMIKKILNTDIKLITKKNMLLFGALIIIPVISFTLEYSVEAVLIRFIAYIIAFKLIFDESIYKTTILCVIIMIINIIGDLLSFSIIMNFLRIEEWRSIPSIMLFGNIMTYFFTYLIFSNKYILNKLRFIAKNINDNNNLSLIIICTSIFILVICILYNIGNIYKFRMSYFLNVLIIITFIIALVVFFIDNNKYNMLLKEYDSLFEYTQTFEDSIDKINLSNHEFKNELAVLRTYIKDNNKSKSLAIIDGIIIEDKKHDSTILNSIKNIPKGGIKGLIYYKIMIATNKKLKISIDISKTIKGKLSDLKIEELKLICNLLGIYLDNAIDASAESSKKLIGIELYTMDNQIRFVISNTFKNKNIDLEKVNKNGYTTKGKGHGRGLYLAKKLITKTEWLEADTKIFNNMYIQKLIINKESIKENKKIISCKTKK